MRHLFFSGGMPLRPPMYSGTMPRTASNPNVAFQMTPPATTQPPLLYPPVGAHQSQPMSTMQSQQQSQQQPMYAQPTYMQPQAPQPAAGNEFMNMASQYMGPNMSSLAQPMMAMGEQMINAQLAQHLQVGASWFSGLRYYFNVSNSYVLQKLKTVLCPFTNKSWKRADPSGGDAASTLQVRAVRAYL